MFAAGGRVITASCVPTPDSLVTASLRERFELAVALQDPVRARETVAAFIEVGPLDQIEAVITLMGAWDDFPQVDLAGDRRTIARQVVAYLEEADREDDA